MVAIVRTKLETSYVRLAEWLFKLQLMVYFTKKALTEPIDVYSDWIDACEKTNQGIEAREDDDEYDE